MSQKDIDVTVHPATAADADVLVAFNIAMAKESEDKRLDAAQLRRGVQAALADPGLGCYFCAESAGTTVGALMVTYEWSDWRNGRFWWIQSVYVDARWRRRGVYRALHEHVLRRARADARSCGVRLYVERENDTAQQTYLAMGMAETRYRLFEEEWLPGKR